MSDISMRIFWFIVYAFLLAALSVLVDRNGKSFLLSARTSENVLSNIWENREVRTIIVLLYAAAAAVVIAV